MCPTHLNLLLCQAGVLMVQTHERSVGGMNEALLLLQRPGSGAQLLLQHIQRLSG